MNEPLFRNISSKDIEIQNAHALASETIDDFVAQVKSNEQATYMAKLRFKDPDESEKLGKDCLLYIWLHDVYFHEEENVLSAEFFEVPNELTKWHEVGQRLAFEPEDVFDWLIIRNGHAFGGFTIRVTRSKLSAQEQKNYDKYVGITSYEPI